MSRVMARMPIVEGKHDGEVLPAVFRMGEALVEVVFRHGLKQTNPTSMQRGNHGYRDVDGHSAVGQVCPGLFIVALDGRPVFSERELEAHVTVGVAVGNVVVVVVVVVAAGLTSIVNVC